MSAAVLSEQALCACGHSAALHVVDAWGRLACIALVAGQRSTQRGASVGVRSALQTTTTVCPCVAAVVEVAA